MGVDWFGVGVFQGDKDDQLSASQLRARHGVQNGTAGSGGDGGMHFSCIRDIGESDGLQPNNDGLQPRRKP